MPRPISIVAALLSIRGFFGFRIEDAESSCAQRQKNFLPSTALVCNSPILAFQLPLPFVVVWHNETKATAIYKVP